MPFPFHTAYRLIVSISLKLILPEPLFHSFMAEPGYSVHPGHRHLNVTQTLVQAVYDHKKYVHKKLIFVLSPAYESCVA